LPVPDASRDLRFVITARHPNERSFQHHWADMKWHSHISTGKAIADLPELLPGKRNAFLDGIVEPDRHKERVNGHGHSYQLGHHHPSRRVFMLRVWMARSPLPRNNSYLGCHHLGMPPHDMQDKSVSKGFPGLTHDGREEAVAELEVTVGAIRNGFDKHISAPDLVSQSFDPTRPLKGPRRIIAQATFRSAAVDTSRPLGMERRFPVIHRRHSLARVPLAAGSLAEGASLSLVWWNVLPLAVSGVLTAKVSLMDRPYHQLENMAKWYGLNRH